VRLLLGVSVLATVTACGEKKLDPYENSLAQGSEHIELSGVIEGHAITGSGDFTNAPDRGVLTIHEGPETIHEVFADRKVFVRVGEQWVSKVVPVGAPQTPAQMFKARQPATIEDGLVRQIVQRSPSGTITIDFSDYGKHVSVTVPRVKGSK
jgi:hypothetical protein